MKNVTVSLTPKQVSILTCVCKGNTDGTPMDLNQLIDSVNYKVTKEAIQYSIRRMIVKKDLIRKVGTETRRGKRRVIYSATSLGSEVYASLL